MITKQKTRVKFELVCRAEMDGETVTKTAGEVSDEARLLINNYAEAQTPPGTSRSSRHELDANTIILDVTMICNETTPAQVATIKTTLENNIGNLPPMSDDGIDFVYSVRYRNDPS